jgi:hypothetical protein
MTDLVRVGLFLLSFGALLISSLACVSALRLGGSAAILGLWIVAGGLIVLTAQALSLVDARVQADAAGAAVLRVNDGVTTSGASSRTTEPETLRVRHRLDERATRIRIAVGAGHAEQDTAVLVRSVFAIPRW